MGEHCRALLLFSVTTPLLSLSCGEKDEEVPQAPDPIGTLFAKTYTGGYPMTRFIFREGTRVEVQFVDAKHGHLGSNFAELSADYRAGLDEELGAVDPSQVESQDEFCATDDLRIALYLPPSDPPPEPVLLWLNCPAPPALKALKGYAFALHYTMSSCEYDADIQVDDDCVPYLD